MYKKRRLALLAVFFLFFSSYVIAQASPKSNPATTVTIFYGRECPYCHKALALLSQLSEKYSFEIAKYEVYHNVKNFKKFEKRAAAFGLSKSEIRVPFIVIGNKYILGYNEDKIRQYVGNYFRGLPNQNTNENPFVIKSPVFGEINLKELSLPMIAIILGLVDGFNPCAMWVLVYLISLLLATRDRKRIWLIVGTFIFASGLLYFLFMTAWLNLFLFVSFIGIVQTVIGVMAIAIGAYHLKKFFTEKELVCKATDSKTKKKIMGKIDKIANSAAVPATFFGIVVLAFTVNLFEFFCSAGIPAVFTKILAMSNLPAIQHYLYILLYDLFYMLDDILVFGAAALTLQMVNISGRYVKIAGAIGGIVLVVLGFALIFFPQALMFSV